MSQHDPHDPASYYGPTWSDEVIAQMHERQRNFRPNFDANNKRMEESARKYRESMANNPFWKSMNRGRPGSGCALVLLSISLLSTLAGWSAYEVFEALLL